MGHLDGFVLMPPVAGACPDCAVDHHPEEPHNAQSMYYQYHFYDKHGYWPTWADALAHCIPEVRTRWVAALAEHGVVIDVANS